MAKTWKEVISEATFVDVAVVDKNTVAFALNNVDIEAEEDSFAARNRTQKGKDKLVFCDIPSETWAGKTYSPGTFHFARCAGGRTPEGAPQALFVEKSKNVTSFVFPAGPRGMEDPMPHFSTDMDLAFIGEHFYTCGMSRGFLRRNGPGDWTTLSKLAPKDEQNRRVGDFVALDGLSEDNIFIAYQFSDLTPHAQIMHWNGERLTPIDLPDDVTSNNRDDLTMFITDLVVAPDGEVYVAGKDGELLVGGVRGFVNLTGPERPALAIRHMCWFKDTLYGGHDAGLFKFDFDEMVWVPALFVDDPNAPFGGPYIDANDDIMVYAGAYNAWVFNGESWTQIAGDTKALDITRLQLKEQQVEDLSKVRDILRDLSGN
jgi:hypothetical protein